MPSCEGGRIAYEGTLTLQTPDPEVGIVELARLLDHTFANITARVRHATKLLDDAKKTFGTDGDGGRRSRVFRAERGGVGR